MQSSLPKRLFNASPIVEAYPCPPQNPAGNNKENSEKAFGNTIFNKIVPMKSALLKHTNSVSISMQNESPTSRKISLTDVLSFFPRYNPANKIQTKRYAYDPILSLHEIIYKACDPQINPINLATTDDGI